MYNSILVDTPFRHRDFALLWAGGLVNGLGTSMLYVALPFYIYQLTGLALAAGATFFVLTLPRLVMGSVAGVFADRWNRRNLMIVTSAASAVIILPLLLVRSSDWIWLVYVVSFLEFSLTQFSEPAGRAMVPGLVTRSQLAEANSLLSVADGITRLLGPALGGLLLGAVGFGSVVLVDVASYALSAALIALIRARAAPSRQTACAATSTGGGVRAVWDGWLDGLAMIGQRRVLGYLFAVQAIALLGNGIFNAVWVVWARSVLGATSFQFGWLESAQGVGFLAGGIMFARLAGVLNPTRMLGASALTLAGLLLAIVNFPMLMLVIALSVVAGPPAVAFFVGSDTALQRGVGDAYLGRAFGALNTTRALSLLIGAGLAAALTDRVGVVAMLDASCVLWLLAGIVALLLFRGGEEAMYA